MTIRKLPDRIWTVSGPYSSFPKLALYSFSVTLSAIALGKYVSPGSPAPSSPRILLINLIADAISIVLAGWVFSQILRGGRLFSRVKRFFRTVFLVAALVMSPGIVSVLGLRSSLVGTRYSISLPASAHLLIAKPYHDSSFATPIQLGDVEMTSRQLFIKLLSEQVDSGKTKASVGFWLVVMVASETGRIEEIDNWVSRYHLRDFDGELDEIKRGAAFRYHATDGLGPFFWVMQTTLLPIVVFGLILILHSFSLLLRAPVAYVFRAAGNVKRPHNLIAVSCGAAAGFFALAARILSW